ncbi:hypothetical protein J9303_01045 [Bacillaceae bacterium Marseille-Q3522]|nr:hypothetical protein [Bacillaceae bacterium Marseille-Q3522]
MLEVKTIVELDRGDLEIAVYEFLEQRDYIAANIEFGYNNQMNKAQAVVEVKE